MRMLTPLLSAVLFAASTTQGLAEMTKDEIRQGFEEHAVLAQYYRWYQFYERPEGGVANALDILTKDIVITSGLGTANGHAEYEARVTQLPSNWQNAHHVKSTEIVHNDDGTIGLSAEITYQNKGLLEDGSVREAELTYTMGLVPGEGVLPLLSEVRIAQNSEGTAESFDDAYAENRVRSLVHYYLAVVEDPARNAEPMRELFADAFSLNFSSGAITDFDGFAAWLAGPGSQVAASTHVVEKFSVEETGENTYAVSMEFDWFGLLPDGTELLARTKHNWLVENDVTERFAHIKTVDVDVLEPFRPKDG